MSVQEWLEAPIGIDSERWVTRAGCRTAIVVVHTMVSCHRLVDVVDYVESDPRVQTVFTVAPDAFNRAVSDHLTELGALVVPWKQATRERFDLALAAASGGLHELHAPLMVMAHGAGRGKPTAIRPQGGPVLTMVRGKVVMEAGRIVAEPGWGRPARQKMPAPAPRNVEKTTAAITSGRETIRKVG